MKVLYGVQGTGNGHITRARVMANALKKAGVEVDWVFSGRADNQYFDMDVFDNYRTFRGLSFVLEEGTIHYWKTARQLRFYQFWKDVRTLDLSQYDLILNDFEPISAWAAKRQGVHSIGLSHQAAFLYDVPKAGNNLFTNAVMRNFAPVKQPLGVHWHHFNHPILPPIVEPAIAGPVKEKHILVYYPFESLDNLLRLFKPFSDFEFHIFHPVEQHEIRGHVQVHPLSHQAFHDQLLITSGVICGAGFELPSEAIQLGKKLLVKPIGGQVEQLSNAKALVELGLASVSESFTQEELGHWLNRPQPAAWHYGDTAGEVVDWLTQGSLDDIDGLVKRLWAKTFPVTESMSA